MVLTKRSAAIIVIRQRSIPLPQNSFPHSSDDKESTCNAGDLGSIPGSGRSLGEGIGHPLQYSGLENSIGLVAKSQTQLSVSLFTATGLVAGANIL